MKAKWFLVLAVMNLAAVSLLIISCLPSGKTLVGPGGIRLADEYVDISPIQKEVQLNKQNTGFYVTYVKTVQPKRVAGAWVSQLKGYERRAFAGESDSDLTASEQQQVSSYSWGTMRHNVITAVLTHEGWKLEDALLPAEVIALESKYITSGYFRVGDRILAINGHELYGVSDITDQLSHQQLGQDCRVRILRDGKEQEITVPIVEKDQKGLPTLGVVVVDRYTTYEGIDESQVIKEHENEVGNSAGLMLALTMIQKLHPENDLTKGYTVAGTGAMSRGGCVEQIGDLKLKIKTASLRRADVFLYPKIQQNEATQAAEEYHIKGMQFIPVLTLEDALQKLKALPK